MLTTITGRTFEHKEHLKSIGALWDAASRCWTHARLSDAQRSELERLGLTVTGGNREPVPGAGDQPRMPASEPARPGKPHPVETAPHHGTDDTYRGAFAARQTLGSFGFASLADMVDYVREIPESIVQDESNERNAGWHTDDPAWAGTPNMRAALDLATNGWQAGADAAAEVAELLTAEHAKRRRSQIAMSGGSVDVGRMLAGNPMHMRKRKPIDGKKIITLFIDGCSSFKVASNILIARAGVVAAICDMLESNGYSCEIIVGNAPHVRHSAEISAYQCAVRVKTAGERLNVNDVVFALGHPSYLRRLVIGLVATENNCRSIWHYMGSPAPLFDANNPPPPNSFHIRKILLNEVAKIRLTSTYAKAHSIFKLIAPSNLPIKLTEDN